MSREKIHAVVARSSAEGDEFGSLLQVLLAGRGDSLTEQDYQRAGLHGMESRHSARLTARLAGLRPEYFNTREKLQGIIDHLRRFAGSANQIPSLEVDGLIAGVSALAERHGLTLNRSRLAEDLGHWAGDLPGEQLSAILVRHDLQTKVLQAGIGSIHESLMPCLLLMNDGGALLLIARQECSCMFIHPITGGELRLDDSELARRYSGIALFANPRNRALDNDSHRAEGGRQWFISRLLKQWPALLEVALASALCSALAIAAALFAMQVYDRVVPTSAFGTLWALAIGVLIAIGFDFVLRGSRAKIMETVGKRLDTVLSQRIFSRVLGLRLDQRAKSTGAFANQVRDFEAIREFFTATTLGAFGDIPFIVLFLAMVAVIGGPLVLVPVAALVLMVLPVLAMQGWLARLSRESLKESAVKHGVLVEAIEQQEAIKAERREGQQLAKWRRLNDEQLARGVQFREVHALLNNWAMTVQQMAAVFLIIFGVYRIDQGLASIGALIACSILASRAIAPAAQINSLLGRWQHVQVALEGLNALMQRPLDRDPERHYARLPRAEGKYRLEELRWHYDADSPRVLDIAALDIAPGERVALLGGNGSGKSTLLRVLAGLYPPSSGRVMLDDLSLTQIDPDDLRRSVAYLPQEVGVYQGSLRDNLAPADRSVDDEELMALADTVGLGAFIRRHPLGLDMAIAGPRSLSGGQRQALGLARLLLSDPDIVLLDEPTAALDSANEAQLVERLLPWLQGRTVVVATHKRAVLRWATRSVVLQEGKVLADDPVTTVVHGQSDSRSTGQSQQVRGGMAS